jgi:phospholipid-binding lipoprotein MlaA
MENKFLLGGLISIILLVFPQPIKADSTQAAFDSSDLDFELEEDETSSVGVWDPLEKVNRPLGSFNRWILKKVRPVTNIYEKRVPVGARVAFGNFFSNLTAPLDIINLGLQGKGKDSLQQVGRFLFNSTVGLAGFFDVSTSELKIPAKKEDFGQTLGYYGVKEGPYLNVPFLGPMLTRDFLCLPLDWSFDLDGYLFPHTPWARYGMSGLELTGKVTTLQYQVIAMEKNALDPYTYTRDAFWQYRQAKVKE